MLKTDKNQHHLRALNVLGHRGLILLVAVVLVVGTISTYRHVQADTLEQQIAALEQQNNKNKNIVSDLMQTATSYENAIKQLQSQIDQLQKQITQNELEKVALEDEILKLQIELDAQKAVLGENIKEMYLDDKMTTIEMLATSKNLSEFVDKETYRNAVQRQIQETMEKIAVLQNELNGKKQKIEALLKSLNQQRQTVQAARAEQANLLAMNQQQQDAFNRRTKANQAKIDDLRAQIEAQRAANSVVPDGGMYFLRFPGGVNDFSPGNYTYRDSGFSMSPLPGCGNPDPWTGQRDSVDKWGYCTRQCVSYAAWAVEASGRYAPRYYGHAKNWVSAAPASYVHRTPKVGDVAISTAGTWGHAMYVEAVSGNQIYVSQYNQQLNGEFSYQWRAWR